MGLSIAHVLTSLHIGGGERVALMLADIHRRAGNRMAVLSFEEPADGPLTAEFERADIEVFKVPKRPGYDVTLGPRVARVCRAQGFDVVHTHNPLPLSYAAPAAKLAGAKVLHTKHGPHPDKAIRLWLRRIGAAFCDAFVAVSKDSAEFAKKIHEVRTGKLHFVPNGIDTSRFVPDEQARTEERDLHDIPGDAWVFATVGRLAEVKNQALLLRAAAPLLGPSCKLVIAGDGVLRSDLEELARELSIADHVRFLGAVSDVHRVLAAADAFVLSSLVEGLPLVLPEAMSTGLPVIATSVGGVPKVIDDGSTGMLVPSKDEDALRKAMESLMGDRTRASALGEAGQRAARERFSAQRMADEYMALYRGIGAGS